MHTSVSIKLYLRQNNLTIYKSSGTVSLAIWRCKNWAYFQDLEKCQEALAVPSQTRSGEPYETAEKETVHRGRKMWPWLWILPGGKDWSRGREKPQQESHIFYIFVVAYSACCSLNGNKTKQKSFRRLFLTEECSPLCIYTPLLLLLLTQTSLQKSMML